MVTTVANGLARTHEVTIICTSPNTKINRDIYSLSSKIEVITPEILTEYKKDFFLQKILRLLNKKIFGIKNATLLRKIYFPKSYTKKFSDFFKSKDFDIIIGTQGKYSILLGLISNTLTSKCYGWQHNSYDAYFNIKHRYYWNQQELFSNSIRRLDGYVVLTDADRYMFYKNLKVNTLRIYNPLSFEKIGHTDGKQFNNLLFVGRLVKKQKGLDYLLKIGQLFFARYPDWKMIIVGEGPDRVWLENQIKEMNLKNNIIVVGKQTDVSSFYKKASVLLNTSRWEGFGLVILEAMVHDVPVISFSTTGPKEILVDGSGILVKEGNIESYVENLFDLLSNEEYRNSISINTRKRIQSFSINNIIAEWERLFRTSYRGEKN